MYNSLKAQIIIDFSLQKQLETTIKSHEHMYKYYLFAHVTHFLFFLLSRARLVG